DLALRDQHLHGLPDLVPGGVPIHVVHLVEVEVIGAQPLQALLAGAADVQGREAALVGPVTHLSVDLGAEHDLVAPAAALGQPAPDDLLGDALASAPAVDVGG